jgi:DNA repair exonuclease SbcCD nuclease subunit
MGSTRKPTRRILHTSDVHMAFPDDKACKEFAAVVNLAIKTRADLMLVAGDLFDHNRIEDGLFEFVREEFRRLPIPVMVIPGNHDCLVPGSVFERKEFWDGCRNLHVFRNVDGEVVQMPHIGVTVWGRPIDTYYDVKPLKDMPQPAQNGSWNICMAHGFYVTKPSQFARSYVITESEMKGTGWDYVALGHMPVFECVCNDPVAYYSGSPDYGAAAIVDLDEESGVQVTRHPL